MFCCFFFGGGGGRGHAFGCLSIKALKLDKKFADVSISEKIQNFDYLFLKLFSKYYAGGYLLSPRWLLTWHSYPFFQDLLH